ncbi:MAG: COX15/CtaA family protein [Gallionella sp.]|nr:COX15/CtaA family protein [Gallionella sp.]
MLIQFSIIGLLVAMLPLAVMIAFQFATGVLTVFLDFPLALALIHNGGAALLVLLLVMLNYKIRVAARTA